METRTPPKSLHYRLAQEKLGDVGEWLRVRVARGDSLDSISKQLYTEGIDVHSRTVENWRDRLLGGEA